MSPARSLIFKMMSLGKTQRPWAASILMEKAKKTEI
jgi:hypothetical protein